MLDLVKVGERIQKLRIQSNITQSEMAEFLSLDKNVVAEIENGKRNIDLDLLEKIANLFCCPVRYLLLDGDNTPEQLISYNTKNLDITDLKAISLINKIVLNQIEMERIQMF